MYKEIDFRSDVYSHELSMKYEADAVRARAWGEVMRGTSLSISELSSGLDLVFRSSIIIVRNPVRNSLGGIDV